ncbi:MAG TPA: hypothetical protein VEA99_02855 [Gemmatimonadaceae bacterium]|nr:hypothetical protein [Gemmatimonadaceae bacterium]
MSDFLGVLLVLALCGLIVPIVLILTAALIDVLALAWKGLEYGHDHLPPAVSRLAHRSHAPAAR